MAMNEICGEKQLSSEYQPHHNDHHKTDNADEEKNSANKNDNDNDTEQRHEEEPSLLNILQDHEDEDEDSTNDNLDPIEQEYESTMGTTRQGPGLGACQMLASQAQELDMCGTVRVDNVRETQSQSRIDEVDRWVSCLPTKYEKYILELVEEFWLVLADKASVILDE